MKNLNVFTVVTGLIAVLGIGSWIIKPLDTPLIAQAQSVSVAALQNLWQRIGQNIFPRDNNWNVGIGTQTPTSKLSVVGTIESTTGGFKFPDGTIQQTAQSIGAGNIAFIIQADEVLKTDGTVWLWSNGWILNPNVPPVPIPVSNIVDFINHNFLDSNGNVWRLSNNVWINVGHP